MTRLDQWAERVTRECEEARRKSRWGDEHAAARAVLSREVRALAREIDCDIQGPAQSWLDADASPATSEPCPGKGLPFNFAGAHIKGAYETVACNGSCRDASPATTGKTCEAWCGDPNLPGVMRNCFVQDYRQYCSNACADAGHPLNPPGGGK